jgi:hypothetical protein
MAIIVEHLDSGNKYVLIAAHSGMDLSAPAKRIFELWLPERVALCDRLGKIFWVNAADVLVVEVDGQKLADLFPEEELAFDTPDPELEPTSPPLFQVDMDDCEGEGEWL